MPVWGNMWAEWTSLRRGGKKCVFKTAVFIFTHSWLSVCRNVGTRYSFSAHKITSSVTSSVSLCQQCSHECNLLFIKYSSVACSHQSTVLDEIHKRKKKKINQFSSDQGNAHTLHTLHNFFIEVFKPFIWQLPLACFQSIPSEEFVRLPLLLVCHKGLDSLGSVSCDFIGC